ncbi:MULTISPECIES: aldehyde dehydrogenase family protein [unclassified Nocardioides]|uniref:aldehyde dehydrogenase family protein n=1 Tax=unclassified Nocardioides TaxID=2615069 RepID=UPI0006F8C815|nr:MULTISPECIES: aldehyde dehydrogenase family protein [unclassified Nocardioides]KRA37803.1 aldehyde dehydrogenase [Nocardioides sp. Root614]KRA91763.1 aldehyde dehydrogenase [Nocardioides sp. Root682]
MTATPAVQGSTAELEALIARLRATYATGRTRTYEWRKAQLEGLLRFCAERETDIAEALAADLGRSPFEAWFGDIAPPKGEAELAIKQLKRWMRPQRRRVPLTQMPASARIQYEPLGVALVIGPWNYPVNLSLGPMVAALAAGNCVVLKPSEVAPATSRLMAEALPDYLDKDALAVVEGDGVVTQSLLALGFDHAFFTGGTEIGRKIMAGAAQTLTPVILELGGKSPAIVTADADLDVVARRIAWVKLMNSGQTCIAPDYVLVHESVKDELVAKLRETMAEFTAGEGPKRIVNQRQFDRLAGYLASTRGTVVAGGGTDAKALTIEPTILVDPDPDEPSMTEEIFGPILPVRSFETVDEVIGFVNGRSKPLGLYVFSRNRAVADRIIEQVPAGGAVINHCAIHYLIPSLPFGGVGASGMGAYHGEWGFQALSHRKSVAAKGFRPDPSLVYPPYGPKARALMRKLF